MKHLKLVTGILAIAFIALTVMSCKDNKKEVSQDDETTQTETKHSETAMAYACPMHPEVKGKKGDTCSKCGMDFKEMKKDMAMAYACPMKCEGDKTYDKEGKCPKCGMNLKEIKTGDDHSGHKR